MEHFTGPSGALTDRATVARLLAESGRSPSKGLGQNFLVNPSVCPRIAQLGGAAPGVGVLEIGPGLGTLTRELAQRAEKVVAVELDDGLRPVLAKTLAGYDNVELVWADVLTLDLRALLRERFGDLPVVVCANLPYYITTPIVMKLLEERLPLQSITVMVQREAAVRLSAPLGSRDCGAVSVGIWYYSVPETLFSVCAGSFYPAPKVDSAVIRLTLRGAPPVALADEAAFFKIARAAFSTRRKALPNALAAGLGLSKEQARAGVLAAGLDPLRRAETLSLEEFARLAQALSGPDEGGPIPN